MSSALHLAEALRRSGFVHLFAEWGGVVKIDPLGRRPLYTLTNLEKSERRRVEQLILSWKVLVQTYQYYV
jgi:hypothetical protein